jgi:hypothetical protein
VESGAIMRRREYLRPEKGKSAGWVPFFMYPTKLRLCVRIQLDGAGVRSRAQTGGIDADGKGPLLEG